ncbi:MAG: hypothetical protein HY074_18525 [Deltaproteobacteria bacterium]|nr:hypothetical protein [Deltaproteobacteria bacterium]
MSESRFSCLALGLLVVLSTPSVRADVLFIGDSHSAGVFGEVLDARLRAPGLSRHSGPRTVARCGASPSWFYSGVATHCGYFDRGADGKVVRHSHPLRAATPLMSTLLAYPVPPGETRITVVALGANMLELVGSPQGRKAAIGSITRMIETVHAAASACIWIGPPQMRKYSARTLELFYGVLAQAVRSSTGERCVLLDSRRHTAYPPQGGDGIHYDFPAGAPVARAWANAAFSEIREIVK